MATRIQRQRAKGWKMPEGAVYVGRPTKWGNPFKVGEPHPIFGCPMDAEDTVHMYRLYLMGRLDLLMAMRRELAGRDLVCWCPPGQPCHADVLLEAANGRNDD